MKELIDVAEMFLSIKAWETHGDLFYGDQVYKITLDRPITINNKGYKFYSSHVINQWVNEGLNEYLEEVKNNS